MQRRAILTIGRKPSGIYVTYCYEPERSLEEFVGGLSDEDKEKTVSVINAALNSCAIQKDTTNPKTDFLYIFYGKIRDCGKEDSKVSTQVKLFVQHSKDHRIFVIPSQRESSTRLLDELKERIEQIVPAPPRDEVWHWCSEDTGKFWGWHSQKH